MPDIRINDVSVQLHKALKQKALDEGISLRALLLPLVEALVDDKENIGYIQGVRAGVRPSQFSRPKRGEPR